MIEPDIIEASAAVGAEGLERLVTMWRAQGVLDEHSKQMRIDTFKLFLEAVIQRNVNRRPAGW